VKEVQIFTDQLDDVPYLIGFVGEHVGHFHAAVGFHVHRVFCHSRVVADVETGGVDGLFDVVELAADLDVVVHVLVKLLVVVGYLLRETVNHTPNTLSTVFYFFFQIHDGTERQCRGCLFL